jgi:hypothetical protein
VRKSTQWYGPCGEIEGPRLERDSSNRHSVDTLHAIWACCCPMWEDDKSYKHQLLMYIILIVELIHSAGHSNSPACLHVGLLMSSPNADLRGREWHSLKQWQWWCFWPLRTVRRGSGSAASSLGLDQPSVKCISQVGTQCSNLHNVWLIKTKNDFMLIRGRGGMLPGFPLSTCFSTP